MRITFLSHFTICLAFAAGTFFAVVNGVPQTIWANDQSMMTSVIAALFVGSASYLGWLAWLAEFVDPTRGRRQRERRLRPSRRAAFGHDRLRRDRRRPFAPG